MCDTVSSHSNPGTRTCYCSISQMETSHSAHEGLRPAGGRAGMRPGLSTPPGNAGGPLRPGAWPAPEPDLRHQTELARVHGSGRPLGVSHVHHGNGWELSVVGSLRGCTPAPRGPETAHSTPSPNAQQMPLGAVTSPWSELRDNEEETPACVDPAVPSEVTPSPAPGSPMPPSPWDFPPHSWDFPPHSSVLAGGRGFQNTHGTQFWSVCLYPRKIHVT